jgi:hypothetical protein
MSYWISWNSGKRIRDADAHHMS